MRPGMKLASCLMPPLWGMGDWVWDREQAIDELHQRTQVATTPAGAAAGGGGGVRGGGLENYESSGNPNEKGQHRAAQRLLVVANRLPVSAIREGDSWDLRLSPGGLVSALLGTKSFILPPTKEKKKKKTPHLTKMLSLH